MSGDDLFYIVFICSGFGIAPIIVAVGFADWLGKRK